MELVFDLLLLALVALLSFLAGRWRAVSQLRLARRQAQSARDERRRWRDYATVTGEQLDDCQAEITRLRLDIQAAGRVPELASLIADVEAAGNIVQPLSRIVVVEEQQHDQ